MPNRLAQSTSPYLRQHADNPVEWHQWGEEAFREAKERDVPILLSVGYASCHWCHVMAHESFEDPEMAALMNARFVNVKVDREERPDVDAVYMSAVQALTGRGGWPMTVWTHPDGRPFYAGTYFPSRPHGGMPSFAQIIDAVTDAWEHRRPQLTDQADKLTGAIRQQLPVGDDVPGLEQLEAAYTHLAALHDPVHGGLGGAPKFPQQPALEFLLRITGRPWAPRAGAMVRQTLERMAAGGIHDHVGGGFARYSVDEAWLVPHFEKMLYDNAQLALVYLHAGQVFDEPWFTEVATRTLDYLARDLGQPDGGFFSAEDADSEGREGAFYVWSEEDFRATARDLAAFGVTRYGVTPEGNFEGETILHIARFLTEVADELGIEPAEAEQMDGELRRRLMEARSARPRPGLDDKVVTAWNGLAIRAFAEAGAVLGRQDLVDRAIRCARFVLSELGASDGRLRRSWSRGEAKVAGFLDDQAAMALGLFALYETTGDVAWFDEAARLTRLLPEHFSAEDGGFHATASDAEVLVARHKDLFDNPSPSGNSMATEALLRLAAYTGEGELVEPAERAMSAAALLVERSPSAVGHLLGAIDFDATGALEVAIVGADAADLTAVVREAYRPNMVLAVDHDGTGADRVPLLEGRGPDGLAMAYVCEDFACLRPTTDPQELREQLEGITVRA